MFSKNDYLDVKGYTDADWTGSVLDKKNPRKGTLHSWEEAWLHGVKSKN
jgi:hypothetical protein